MNESVYFFDTYAFFEIIRGNPAYKKYQNAVPITTILNIAELNYGLKKELGKATADNYAIKYSPFVANINTSDVISATDLKLKNKKMSLADVIGYALANKLNVKFLTGDEQFRNMENVEFVK